MVKRKKKKDLIAPILFLVALVMLALVIVGVCIDWVTTTTTVVGSVNTTTTLSKLFEANSNVEIENFSLMASFTLITVIACGLAVLIFGTSLIIKLKLIRFLALALGIIGILAAIIAIITCYKFCDTYSFSAIGGLLSNKSVPAVGAWLMTVGGVLSGVCVAAGAVRSN